MDSETTEIGGVNMFKTGVFFLKGLPPHRGHLYQIIEASTQCELLYVVICDHAQETEILCKEAGIPIILPEVRKKWMSQELQDFENVKTILYKEDTYADIQPYPNSWSTWMQHLIEIVPLHIDVFFVGEREYQENIPKYCDSQVVLFDYSRSRYPVSGTMIRNLSLKYWDYILGSARPFFAKKILITGTESCGKTTLTTKLAKLYYTSWSDEVGRHYAKNFLGGDESIFTDEDFRRIAHQQYEQDAFALRNANRVVFFDTDATVTQYYSELYSGKSNSHVESFVDPSRYDLVLFLSPDVDWVNDGQRLNGEQKIRDGLNKKLIQMYKDRGFADKMLFISGNYHKRLESSISAIDKLLVV